MSGTKKNKNQNSVKETTETVDANIIDQGSEIQSSLVEEKLEEAPGGNLPEHTNVDQVDGPPDVLEESPVIEQIEDTPIVEDAESILEEVGHSEVIEESLPVVDDNTDKQLEVGPSLEEQNAEVMQVANIRKPFEKVVPVWNGTPTGGMAKFQAVFNPNGDTERDVKNQHFAAIHDYINNRSSGNYEIQQAIATCSDKLDELYQWVSSLDGYFTKE